MTCGIYMIQNKVNGKIYIGQAVDIEKRWRNHKCELRGNYHGNKHLQHAWNKNSESNFEFTIICECDESQLNTMEEYYIFESMSYDRRVGYNKTYGGEGGRPTKETRKKLSEVRKKCIGENNPMYGKHHSEGARRKISENNARYWKGKTFSEETRKKLSEANKGKTGVKCPHSIPVVQLTLEGELVKVYDAAMEAARNGFSQGNIGSCCRGERKTHKGYKWMYLSDYESMKKEGLEK